MSDARNAAGLLRSGLLGLSNRIAEAQNEDDVCHSLVESLRHEAFGFEGVGLYLAGADAFEPTLRACAGAFEIGVITAPAAAAQDIADALAAAGIHGILNFAPRKLFVPKHVTVRNVDMTLEFESLSFALAEERSPRKRRARG